jgi:hypothetical protein
VCVATHYKAFQFFSFGGVICYITEQHLDKVDWPVLSRNPNAIQKKTVWWDCLSGNPNAIRILETHLDKVVWSSLSENPNGGHILLTIKHRNRECATTAADETHHLRNYSDIVCGYVEVARRCGVIGYIKSMLRSSQKARRLGLLLSTSRV